jgi:CHAT domain-containing protein
MDQMRGGLMVAEHRISFFSSLARFYDDYVEFLVESGSASDALRVADDSRALLLREKLGMRGRLPAVSAARAQEAARALDAVILCYWLAAKRSFLWVVTPTRTSLHVLPGEKAIREQVALHQSRIAQSRDPLLENAPEAEWLYQNLVEPAASAIQRGARVVVLPDGPLHQINPETLVVAKPERHYWLEDVVLITAPSLSLLAQKAAPARRASNVLIIGDPVEASPEFPRLIHAEREMQTIAEQFDPSQRSVYSDAQADPSVYKAAGPGRFGFIHFAAHAKANSEVPLDSAVILSNVIAGLWNVEDTSTADLMGALYRGLRNGQPPAEALRSAKLGLLRSESADRKPYYWAPFMVYSTRRARSGSAH